MSEVVTKTGAVEWKPIGNGIMGAAEFSPCRRYRYWLGRSWEPRQGFVGFIGLNPSTADERENDPTIRRCFSFAVAMGFGGLYMLNLFAFRATDPHSMKAESDPVGPANDETLDYMATKCQKLIACWGVNGTHLERSAKLGIRGRVLECFGLTKNGQPLHPLYLPADSKLIVYRSPTP